MVGRWHRAVSRGRRVTARTPDDGFTLIEVIVAMMLIGIVMAATTTFFIAAGAVTGQRRGQQTAVQVANSATEQVRALRGKTIVSSGLPTIAAVTVNGVTYTTNLGATSCWQKVSITSFDGVCSTTQTGGYVVPFTRVTATVTWPDSHCAASTCSYVTSTLVNGDTDPQFNVGS
jgi:prepilin-type N-terminal cleavage/methylation domain-containing protein